MPAEWTPYLHLLWTIPLAHVYCTAMEWIVHRFVFHGLGKRKGSRFRFHYHDHHKACRRQAGGDDAYEGSMFAWNAYGREVLGLVVGGLIHLPVAFIYPPISAITYVYMLWRGFEYHRIHKKSHLDPEWCREHLPGHWDHHMTPHNDANWCVTNDWFDKLVGTRKVYVPKDQREQAASPAK